MIELASPSKINLFLRVLNRRPDGYHELASLFQAIDLCDRIQIRLSDKDHLTCSLAHLPIDQTNLAYKALTLFRKKTGIHEPVEVYLEKNIPIQAGLGGGSGNAATTLWGLNELFGRPATEKDLSCWAAEIGSDISFFFSQGTAYCTGRGEHVQPLTCLPSTALWIVKPGVGLSTPKVFGNLRLGSLQQRCPQSCLKEFTLGRWECFNDLEESAFQMMPELQVYKQKLLDSGFSQVHLCGSGSSLWCQGEGSLPKFNDAEVFRVNFINRSSNAWY